ncbi:uncharacterized protein LOC131879613 [Tigriopus californicus]|uniref:uncharacterized protein LOC131879613 n=1 Tax=Tigriopus californicus TaxID=6832 RepID=UPI0027DA0C4F|nr:uncharacterized protein LOC131879613 [Tigriopus californicus]
MFCNAVVEITLVSPSIGRRVGSSSQNMGDRRRRFGGVQQGEQPRIDAWEVLGQYAQRNAITPTNQSQLLNSGGLNVKERSTGLNPTCSRKVTTHDKAAVVGAAGVGVLVRTAFLTEHSAIATSDLMVMDLNVSDVTASGDLEQRKNGDVDQIRKQVKLTKNRGAAECAAKGGVMSGTCASGYGVCCILNQVNQNAYLFWLRLDFNNFVIEGPTGAVSSEEARGSILNGITVSQKRVGTEANEGSRCPTDRFSVTNPGSSAPPIICGINTGEHMYVDASDSCNELAFQFGSSSSVSRQWSIKITQYGCDYDNLAPKGCTQYHFGNSEGVLKTYNYDGGVHLANQLQNIGIRQERGNCEICYAPILESDFQVSGTSSESGFTGLSRCCAYGTKGNGTTGYDCLAIPGALKQDGTSPNPGSLFCGYKLVTSSDVLGVRIINKTICTKQRPFHITFRSDNYEFYFEGGEMMRKGFRLAYSQKGC